MMIRIETYNMKIGSSQYIVITVNQFRSNVSLAESIWNQRYGDNNA